MSSQFYCGYAIGLACGVIFTVCGAVLGRLWAIRRQPPLDDMRRHVRELESRRTVE